METFVFSLTGGSKLVFENIFFRLFMDGNRNFPIR
jgi:hypothetical protein